MLKRLQIYLNEMFPPLERLMVALLIFFEVYYILLLNNGLKPEFPTFREAIGVFTIFSFLLLLRIADDFKDYESDLILFKERPLPSGRVKKKDLVVLLSIIIPLNILLNALFMNNFPWFLFLYIYGFLMSMWFFNKAKIQKNLFLALVTHNPIVMIINLYALSYTSIKYGIRINIYTVLLAFTLYFPGLIWEIARKIRAPKEENDYVTYSKLIGYDKAVRYVTILTLIDVMTNLILIYKVQRLGIILLIINLLWFLFKVREYLKDPYSFKIIKVVERYTLMTEIIMVLGVFLNLKVGNI